MPSFRHAPKFRPATLVEAQPSDTAGLWDCVTASGDAFPVTDAQLRQLGHPIHRADNNGAGLYALLMEHREPAAFQIDHAKGVVEFEEAEPVALKDFIANSVRVDDKGATICSFVEPLHLQYSTCKEKNATAHLFDVQQTVAHARQEGFTANVGMYDIIVAGLEDTIPFLDRMMAATAPSWSTDAVDTLERTGAPVQAWLEIKDHPHYTVEPVRVMFRDLMGPYIGDFPIERVKFVVAAPGSNLEDFMELALPRTGTNAPFRAPNIMAGYETSEVAVFGDEHVEAIVFSDMQGVYAYAWPRQPKLDEDLTAGGPRA